MLRMSRAASRLSVGMMQLGLAVLLAPLGWHVVAGRRRSARPPEPGLIPYSPWTIRQMLSECCSNLSAPR